MTNLTVEEFVDVVHQSKLIAKRRLMDALSNCKQNGGFPERAIDLAEFLRQQGLLTAWQQKRLLQGRSKGYYLGDYRLLEHLGTGGMGSVYLGEHRFIQRKVAIKILPSAKANEGTFLRRFEQEARATSRLSHPNVVRVFDIDQHGETHFMVMEYVRGQDLKEVVRQEGPLPLDRVAHYIAQAACGLEHAHQRGLIHRDMKPANIVVNHDDMVKILDLGLARILGDDDLSSLTIKNDENMMGTADYQAPEQARNAHAVDWRADIYSLGCTLYYLLAGHAPFTEGTIAQRILMHQNQPPLDIRAIRQDCPHAIADVCMTMLAKQPQDRIQSAATVAQRLHRWLTSNGLARDGATYAFHELPVAATHSEPAAEPTLLPGEAGEVGQASLVEQRKVRSAKQVRTPLALWVLIGVLVVVCLILATAVVLRGS